MLGRRPSDRKELEGHTGIGGEIFVTFSIRNISLSFILDEDTPARRTSRSGYR